MRVGSLILTLVLLAVFAAGLWSLNQVLDSVIALGRGYVNVPGFTGPVSVWSYHDFSYAALWGSYTGLVVLDAKPWRPGGITIPRVLAFLAGFVVLTAGLWISQDVMNAALILHRTVVDLPFFVTSLDLYQARTLVVLLVCLPLVAYYSLTRSGAAS